MKRIIKYWRIKLGLIRGKILTGNNIDELISQAKIYIGINYEVYEPIYVGLLPCFRILLKVKNDRPERT